MSNLAEVYSRVCVKCPEAKCPGLDQGWRSKLWTHENVEATDGEGKPAWAAFADDIAAAIIVQHWLKLLASDEMHGIHNTGSGYMVWDRYGMAQTESRPTPLEALASYLENRK